MLYTLWPCKDYVYVQKFAGWLIKFFSLNLTHAHNTVSSIIARYSSLVKMPRALSTDLRWRAVWLYLAHNLEVAEISQCLSVSQSSVYRYIELFQRTGDVKPRSYRHGPPKLLGDLEQLVLLRLILNNPGIYLGELQARLLTKFGVTVDISTICRTLKFMGCTRQVIQRVALQCSDEQRAKFIAEVSRYDPSMLLCIDESGHNCMRKREYSLRGMTPKDHRLMVRGTRYSAI